jgi:hypothetical protein
MTSTSLSIVTSPPSVMVAAAASIRVPVMRAPVGVWKVYSRPAMRRRNNSVIFPLP